MMTRLPCAGGAFLMRLLMMARVFQDVMRAELISKE